MFGASRYFPVTTLLLFGAAAHAASIGYTQVNLVSDLPGIALHQDANLVNPWGISSSATSPFWISDNGTGLSTLYNTSGTPQGLVVTIPNPGGGTSAPTGQVFNGTGAFGGDIFLFATENGTIAGWRGALGTTAETLLDNSASNAAYKGLAIGTISGNTYLYAADFVNNQITVLPNTGAPALSGNFIDPSLPSGYAPFNIQNINGLLYVAYAKQGSGIDEDSGPGNGYVSVFDLNGTFQQRLISNGPLNSPWGLALSPAGWGDFPNALLVGNFGDGTINAFDPTNGNFLGTISDTGSNPLGNDGLWALKFGNGGNGGNPNSLYLTAGLNDEQNGLFAQIDPAPEPATLGLTGAALMWAALLRRKLRRQRS